MLPAMGMREFERVTLRGETNQRLKDLAAFRPKNRTSSDPRELVALADAEMQVEAESSFRQIRDSFRYKRKDLQFTSEPGQCEIATPDFNYRISIFLDPAQEADAIWRREIFAIKDDEIVRSEPFQNLLHQRFNQLIYAFEKKVSLENFIDRLEEKALNQVSVDYDGRTSWCEIGIEKLPGLLRLTPNELTISGDKLLTLFEYFKQSLDGFALLADGA